MSFAWPLGLIALLVVPAMLAFAIAAQRRPARDAVAFTNLDVLASVVEEESSWRPWIPLALVLLALTFAATALARPHAKLPSRVDNATVVLLVDVSGSMRAEDVEPTRLDAAKQALRTFLDQLPDRFRVGLVQFSSQPEVLVQPTHDRLQIRDALNYLEPDAGTAIGDGMARAIVVLRKALAEERRVSPTGKAGPGVIVLLSDGTQTDGRRYPLDTATAAGRADIPFFTVALGTTGPDAVVRGPRNTLLWVPPDPELMGKIAELTGARTYTASTAQEMDDVYAGLSSRIGRVTKRHEITGWLVLAAAVALVAAVGLSRLFTGALAH